jgi:hypothetical protein
MRLGDHAYQTGELDVLSKVRLVGQRLRGRQEPEVFGGEIWRRHGCTVVSAYIVSITNSEEKARVESLYSRWVRYCPGYCS